MEFVPGDRSGIYTCVIPNKRRAMDGMSEEEDEGEAAAAAAEVNLSVDAPNEDEY